jgi:hypothetical protein
MRLVVLMSLSLLAMVSLSGCKSDPQQALDEAAAQLQENLEGKKTGAVYDQLHSQFLAQQQNDRTWARQTMAGLFLKYRNIRIVTFRKDSHIDPTYQNKGYTEAEVGMTGAEGLIPDAAHHYSVKLEWWREGGDWKLARLAWQ